MSLLIPVYATSAKVYVWRDESGVLVFSDSPKPGAEEIEINTENQNISSSIDTSILDIKPKKLIDNFEVDIIRPTNNSTIRDNSGSVHVSGRIKPVFKQGLTIQLILDDIPYKAPQTHSMFALRDIERGEHQIKLVLLNATGKVIASSKSVTFYMHRMSVNKAN
ncbi:DUF4124 domain-containing protein [Pseudocolwellia sp. HL-MZ19]|uniref:DUF4124 domain-containing protein n=1 Tax=unclassified Pseudocolwellia TaxID=2848178 RepID=UPI003CF93E5B